MNVIKLPRDFVAIDCGLVRDRVENQDGVGPWSAPRFEYRVEWCEPDGTTIVWSGLNYEDALHAASDWKLPIVDRTGAVQ